MIRQRWRMMWRHWKTWKLGFRYCRKCKGWHYKETLLCKGHDAVSTYYFD